MKGMEILQKFIVISDIISNYLYLLHVWVDFKFITQVPHVPFHSENAQVHLHPVLCSISLTLTWPILFMNQVGYHIYHIVHGLAFPFTQKLTVGEKPDKPKCVFRAPTLLCSVSESNAGLISIYLIPPFVPRYSLFLCLCLFTALGKFSLSVDFFSYTGI